MERETLESRVIELIDNSCETMKERVAKVLDSGAVDIERAEDNYLLPKIILKALLKDAEFAIGLPFSERKAIEKEVDNIYSII